MDYLKGDERRGLLRTGIVVASLALQSGAVYLSQGFEGNVFGSSTSLLGQ